MLRSHSFFFSSSCLESVVGRISRDKVFDFPRVEGNQEAHSQIDQRFDNTKDALEYITIAKEI